MDLLIAGDRQIQNPNDFPLQVAPFPPIGNFNISTSATAATSVAAVVGSSDVVSLLPQKLRPIRGTGRVPSSSGEDGGEKLRGLVGGEASDVAVNGGGRVGSGSGEAFIEDEFSLSSSDGNSDDSSVGVGESVGRKRKRKSKKKIKKFLQSLVVRVMEKQEQMHKQLVEVMENRERERIIREEAWKQQEMERMQRDNEARAQETSRNLALISFIQNVTGHVFEVPQPLKTISRIENDVGNAPIQNHFKCDQSNRRWPEDEVQALITLRTAWEQQSRVTGSKGSNIWDAISSGMFNMGYNRTAKKCKEKWENINKHFKKSVGSAAKKPLENITTSPYFQELDSLYNDGFVNLGNGSTNTDNQTNCALGNG
ncbi:unnamed protein product [Dovyalis caffra]|uniref:Myb-like domain-containing protein n=1 Tax=Dovyalis caffra TaxID=77055 RepID=A0AAV1QS37_9ROSI|nr:unnamed protein product [Dovyalis caffra]